MKQTLAKAEHITDNVRRAWECMANVPRGEFIEYWTDERMSLEDALNLLHWVAERAAYHTWMSMESIGQVWYVSAQPNSFDGYLGTGSRFNQKNSDSLLHAILLAIDAIVEHKKGEFI